MGGGASLMVPMKFSVVTEKTVFATPEASIGFHTDCGFSYIHSRLPGHLGEFLALTGARLNGKELVAVGMATHFVPSALHGLKDHVAKQRKEAQQEVIEAKNRHEVHPRQSEQAKSFPLPPQTQEIYQEKHTKRAD
ncbi:hypothetical protein YC2023_012040 [Brassica napus]